MIARVTGRDGESSDRRQKDRRKTHRRRVVAMLRFLRTCGSSITPFRADLEDVSSNGARLVADRGLETSEQLLVEVWKGKAPAFHFMGEVVWSSEREPGKFEIGCRFSRALTARELASVRPLSTPLIRR